MKKANYVIFHRYEYRYWLLLLLGGTALAGLMMSLIWTFIWSPGAKIRRQNCCKKQSQLPVDAEENQRQETDNRENIELLPKNEIETAQQVIIGNVAGNVTLITAEEDETRNKKKKSCLERLKEIHVAYKILAVLLGIFIALSPFIPMIIDRTRVETSTTAITTITTTTTTTAVTAITTDVTTNMPTTTMTMKKVKNITSLIPKGSLI